MSENLKNKLGLVLFFMAAVISLTSCDDNQIDIFGYAKIKIVNAAPHSKTQHFFFISGIIARDLDYSESTNSYLSVKSGDKLAAQFRDQSDGNTIASGSIYLQNKDRYTIYLAEDNSGRERIYSFKDDLSSPQKGKVKVKFIHLSGTGPSEVSFSSNTAGVSAEVSRNNQTRYYELNPGPISISVKKAGQDENEELSSTSTPQLIEGKIYTIVFTSSYNNSYDLLLFRQI
ncbi:DUF4397 domain-containing protein [Flavobacterium sp. CFBP9031]|uniref:DUF4397 domain-containing protein n=1 Tax=Flavobacterium sp. CFBP9031 TaxID=3096538 RepID=UPI002A6B36D5|nr:DUF4397 domain-containing protein [Flavobacterium sp. CFBP9031]MDY0986671.1 DUF4397 domain-containing protein [Flavobacterium sp. CFBP9031]